jgi:hypothetical protein
LAALEPALQIIISNARKTKREVNSIPGSLLQYSHFLLSQRRDSNPRPADYKSAALPAELLWLFHSGNNNFSVFMEEKSIETQDCKELPANAHVSTLFLGKAKVIEFVKF